VPVKNSILYDRLSLKVNKKRGQIIPDFKQLGTWIIWRYFPDADRDIAFEI